MGDRVCFVAMPFLPELNYFFLYLKGYLWDKYRLRLERGDHRFTPRPLLHKIKYQIQRADVVIGEITAQNANVFYELGIADAYGKPLILLTRESAEKAPVDVRHLELIVYDLNNDRALLAKLDNAVSDLLVDRYATLRQKAVRLLEQLNRDRSVSYEPSSPEEFQARVIKWEPQLGDPESAGDRLLAEFLLPKIVEDSTDLSVLREISVWIEERFGG